MDRADISRLLCHLSYAPVSRLTSSRQENGLKRSHYNKNGGRAQLTGHGAGRVARH